MEEHAWRDEKCMKGRENAEDLGVDVKIVLEQSLGI
jgi:hypothetical protein